MIRAAALLFVGVLTAASSAAPLDVDALGFSEGLRRLDVGDAKASACGRCHAEEHEEWARSRHKAAFTNEVFARGFARERESRCVRCHAPQAARVDDPATHEGVSCGACHVRKSALLIDDATQAPAEHPAVQKLAELDAAIEQGVLCKGCHQFRFHVKRAGRTELVDEPMQSTWDEWLSYREGGGSGTCVSCHMPRGSHHVRGAHDLSLLRSSLVVERAERGLLLSSRGVGHSFPTGDLFRHMTVEARTNGGPFVVVARLGREFEVVNGESGAEKRLSADTSLVPGQTRSVPLPAGTDAWRVRYFFVDDEAYASGRVPEHEAVVTVVEGRP